MDAGIIKRFVDEVLQKPSVTVIKADSYSSAPAKPYAIVKVFSDKESGFPISEIESVSESEANQLMSVWSVASVELQFYSNDNTGEFSSQNLAKFFITALGFQRSKIFQRDNGFGVLNVRPRINADIALGDLTERRQIVEFTVNHVYTISDTDVDFFNEAGVRITVNQEA
jgi:hypothetical protein